MLQWKHAIEVECRRGRTDITRQLRVSIRYSFLSKAPTAIMPLSGRMPRPAMGPDSTNNSHFNALPIL